MRILLFLIALWGAPLAAQDVRLMMVDEVGCVWCARWTEELGDIYPKTPEGRAAPLFRNDIHDPLPEGVTLKRTLHYTPTFVLLVDGQEINRIEGYPGEDFFWGLLGMMLEQADVPLDEGS
ncbi:hypothetical protein [Shimia ponticola]|uniref:hypothetical protein n=1 Tax=Shimia ponticola TaxID=2582893 RepID=UPI0011BECE68|nr:hypothetical protein [Shimia ponticola]